MAELLNEYMLDFSGGQNASLDPDTLPENVYASGVNVTNENGVLRPRWGLRTLKLDFTNTGSILKQNGLPVDAEKVFTSGRFQALIPYSVSSDYHVIAIISGYIFLIQQDTLEVIVMNKTDPLNINAARINWSPADRFLVLFDYPSVPMILEGLSSRRSDPTKDEIPVSVIGGYNQNRLMIGNAGNEFTFSDPAAYDFPDGPISFTEINTPASPYVGQVFKLSTNYGNDPITGMGFLQFTDASTGIGPALIGTSKQVFSYQTQNPRATWLAGQFGSALLSISGFAGQRGQINVNSDMLFIAPDAQVRALSMSRDQQKRWGNFPISIEVSNYLLLLDKRLSVFSWAGYYQNKIFFGANPFRTHGADIEGNQYTDYAFAGFVALELNSVSGLSGGAVPTWAGLWTGIRPMDMVNNNEQAFLISKDEGFGNVLYSMDPTISYDVIRGKERNVRSILYSRSFNFKQPGTNKLLHSLNVDIDNIQGDFHIEASYKASHSPNYTFWREYDYTAPIQQCSDLITAPNGLSGHSIRDFYLGGVPNELECNPATQETYSTFKKVQLQFEIIGRNWNFAGFNLKATIAPQTPTEVLCEKYPPTLLPLNCLKDWTIYDPTINCS